LDSTEQSSEEHEQPEAASSYAAGDTLAGRYRLLRLLASGGMGEVWVALHEALDIEVAVKVVRAGSFSELAAERLLVEARAAASLDHPAIVRVFDVGRSGEKHQFIVMELLEGETLADLIDRSQAVPATQAVALLLPIAAALVAAHAKGIVHRDVKPDNVFLAHLEDRRVQPKILDFGIVKLKQSDKRLTRDGIVLGSIDYVSPEQARGSRELDERVDVWSLCVVLYEAIAGWRPFQGDDYRELLRAIVKSPHRSLTEYGLGDAELSALVDRGLEKDPAARWPSMLELGNALAGWLARQGVHHDAVGTSLAASWSAAPPPLAPPAPRSSLEPTLSRPVAPQRTALLDPPADRARYAENGAASVPAEDAVENEARRAYGARVRRRELSIVAATAAGVVLLGGIAYALVARRAPATTAQTAEPSAARSSPRPIASPASPPRAEPEKVPPSVSPELSVATPSTTPPPAKARPHSGAARPLGSVRPKPPPPPKDDLKDPFR
jgi:eukaryotic-like serine/threonine-protein kinase